jgi:hypothetical protein
VLNLNEQKTYPEMMRQLTLLNDAVVFSATDDSFRDIAGALIQELKTNAKRIVVNDRNNKFKCEVCHAGIALRDLGRKSLVMSCTH